MKRFQSDVFEQIEVKNLIGTVGELKERGFRFVQICATTLEDSCEILYSFLGPDTTDDELFGLIITVPDGEPVPSITQFYPAAFVFENETHDLFGIDIYGIDLDFKGEFYVVSEKYPMNPRAAVERMQEEGEEAAHE